MRKKILFFVGIVLMSVAVCVSACGKEETTSVPEENAPNAEFADAPETAPVIIEPDSAPEEETSTEIYNDAPEVMPEMS